MSDFDITTEKRTRTLTEKGQELFGDQCKTYTVKLTKTWQKIEELLIMTIDEQHDIKTLNNIEKELSVYKTKYFDESKQYMDFLLAANSDISKENLADHQMWHNKAMATVDKKLQEIKSAKLDEIDSVSVKSSNHGNRTNGSVHSDSSSVLHKKRLKAEAERVKLQFMQREANLERERAALTEQRLNANAASERKEAELKVDLNLLKQQSDIAVTEAEVKALENIELEERGLPPEPVDRETFT